MDSHSPMSPLGPMATAHSDHDAPSDREPTREQQANDAPLSMEALETPAVVVTIVEDAKESEAPTASRRLSGASRMTTKRTSTMRTRKSRPISTSSSNSSFSLRDSMIGGTGTLRETIFGARRNDPLELSSNQEFDLTVIDEHGGMNENIGEILVPLNGRWSRPGSVVASIGFFVVLITFLLAMFDDTLDGYNIDPGLVFGALQTLILCVIVLMTYQGVQAYQVHPNPLVMYKCIIDILLSLRFLLDPLLESLHVYTAVPKIQPDDISSYRHSCRYLSGVTEFLLLASECWYFAQIIDLYMSLTNPFTSVKGNRRTYKIVVYTLSGFMGFLVTVTPDLHGFADGSYCWTHRGNSTVRNFFKLNAASWFVFYDFMIMIYLSGIAVLIFGVRRLRSGLLDTLQTRRDMLRNGAISIMSYTAYWTFAFTWYAVSFQSRLNYDDKGTMLPSRTFRSYAYVLTGRGIIDYIVWFTINKPSMIPTHWLKYSSESADHKFSAQLNTALQHELIYFTIEGLTKAIQKADESLFEVREHSPTPNIDNTEDRDPMHRQHNSESSQIAMMELHINPENNRESAAIESMKASEELKNSLRSPASKSRVSSNQRISLFGISLPSTSIPHFAAGSSSTNKIKFTHYKPEAFAELRVSCGIDSSHFLESFASSTKPNISEGASGAFIFFSGDKRFIVKSMAEAECRFLCEIADDYVEYLITNPSSLVTKFYGCFKITMYQKNFYFVVMENLFHVAESEGVLIHHRFDIKGSWVNRSYKRPRRGAKVKCRHCSMQFKYGANKALLHCPNVVGLHEPNVVLKDNDLRTRMRIGNRSGKALFDQLRADSLFLKSLGIMDYSLLMGVVDIEFVVEQSRRNTATSVSGPTDSRRSLASFMSTESSDRNLVHDDTMSDAATDGGGGGRKLSHEANESGHSVRSLRHASDGESSEHLGLGLSSSAHPQHSMRKSKRIFGPGYYYVGIIDILQTWTLQKRMERFLKVNLQRCDPDGLSAIDPEQYQRRFEAKLREIISLPKESEHKSKRSKSSKRPKMQALSETDEHEYGIGGESGRGLRIEQNFRSTSSHSTTTSTGDEDLEGTNRNPQPILMQFSGRLLGSAGKSNLSFVQDARDVV